MKRPVEWYVPEWITLENFVFSWVTVLFQLLEDLHWITFVIVGFQVKMIIDVENLRASTMQNDRCFGLLLAPLASM